MLQSDLDICQFRVSKYEPAVSSHKPMSDMPTLPEPEILPLGVDGVLVRFARALTETANTRALAFRAKIDAAGLPGVTEVASSLVSVRVGFDPEITNRTRLVSQLEPMLTEEHTSGVSKTRIWRIPAAFGADYAPQLAEAADIVGVSEQKLVDEIAQTTVRVMAIGFAPGQPYLGLLPPALDLPRQTALTERTPRGALVTAVRQLIVWGADAPTGWRHIGQTAFSVYTPGAQEPIAFAPGDQVRFVPVSDTDFRAIVADTASNGGATYDVVQI